MERSGAIMARGFSVLQRSFPARKWSFSTLPPNFPIWRSAFPGWKSARAILPCRFAVLTRPIPGWKWSSAREHAALSNSDEQAAGHDSGGRGELRRLADLRAPGRNNKREEKGSPKVCVRRFRQRVKDFLISRNTASFGRYSSGSVFQAESPIYTYKEL